MEDKQKKLSRQILLQQIEFLLEAQDRESLTELLSRERSSDIAEVVELLDDDRRQVIFDFLDEDTSSEVLEKVGPATRAALFDILNEDQIKRFISRLDYDDAADLLAELPEHLSSKVLSGLTPTHADQIRKLSEFPADSAGGIMDPVVISVQEKATVTEAIKRIRSYGIDEDFYSVYVVDNEGKFLGDVRIRMLLTASEDTKISRLTDTDTIYVVADDDQERVRNVFSKNDLIVVPVLDKQHKLIGRITADRVIEVAEQEAAEDLYAMAGTEPDELETFSVFHAARVRMTWLLPCLIGTGITALVLTLFKDSNRFVYLAAVAFAPMIAAISGNAGLQTSAIVISGLATGHLAALKFSQVFTREVRIALLVALSCAIVGGLVCLLLMNAKGAGEEANALKLVFALGTAMFVAIMISTTLGLFLPFFFKRIRIDPAISSGPLVTTANDSISVTIYMTLALLLVAR